MSSPSARFEAIRAPGPRIDSSSRAALTSAFRAGWDRGASVIALDMSSVTHIDSLGISVLVSLHRTKPAGGQIVVTSLNDYVRDVFEVTQFFRLCDVYGSVDAARAALAGDGP